MQEGNILVYIPLYTILAIKNYNKPGQSFHLHKDGNPINRIIAIKLLLNAPPK